MKDLHERATYLWVAETILREHRRPMSARQLVDFGLERGLFDDKEVSRTPQKSMQARLSTEIIARQKESRFVRTSKGRFFMRELLGMAPADDDLRTAEYKAVRRTPAPPTENVLVIPKRAHKTILKFQGLSLEHQTILPSLLNRTDLTYVNRTDAEINSSYKQFVTYTVIQRKNEILSFRRGQYNRAASFLRGARCIGFGGHVTADDLTLFTVHDQGIRANAAREISEEIRFKEGRPHIEPSEIEVLGIINDDSSEVGVRHVGVVLRYWAPNTPEWSNPIRGEASVSQLRWIKVGEEQTELIEFEYWSQLVLRGLYPDFMAGRPAYRVVRRAPFQEPHLLCVTGSIGSGKTVSTRRLCERHGYLQINTGQIVAKLVGAPPVPDTPRAEFQRLALDFISKTDGPGRLAAAIMDAALQLDCDRVVIDGIRQLETLEKLKALSTRRVATVYVHTPPDVAYRMYALRETQTRELTVSKFMEIYNAPVESEVRYFISEADVVIYNWIGLDDYEVILEKMIVDLGLD